MATRQKPSPPELKFWREFPWLATLVALIGITALIWLFIKASSDSAGWGSGLRVIYERSQQQNTRPKKTPTDVLQSSEKQFEFYELLSDMEKVMPDDLPEAAPDLPDPSIEYYIQAASFRSRSDADNLRARFALRGFQSITQAREVAGQGIYFRIRLGPYQTKRAAKTVKNKISRLGVRPFIFTTRKESTR